jgi:Flp pilus assembly protein TadG
MMRFGSVVRRKRVGEKGTTMSEFALVCTIFFMLSFGIIELGSAVMAYNSLCDAAREAVRYAIVHSPTSANPATTAQIKQVAINTAPNLGITSGQISVTFPADANLPSLTDALVTISYPYVISIPFMPTTSVTMSTSSRMLVSQ